MEAPVAGAAVLFLLALQLNKLSISGRSFRLRKKLVVLEATISIGWRVRSAANLSCGKRSRPSPKFRIRSMRRWRIQRSRRRSCSATDPAARGWKTLLRRGRTCRAISSGRFRCRVLSRRKSSPCRSGSPKRAVVRRAIASRLIPTTSLKSKRLPPRRRGSRVVVVALRLFAPCAPGSKSPIDR